MATQNFLGTPVNGEFNYCIQGTNVTFPCKAYPSQLAVMNRILKGLSRQQNCLIESPTGSGKSLALLCSCLAWQRAIIEKNRLIEEKQIQQEIDRSFAESIDFQYCEELNSPNSVEHKMMKTKGVHYFNETTPASPENYKNKVLAYPNFGPNFNDDDDDFKPPKKFHSMRKSNPSGKENIVLEVKTATNVAKFLVEVPASKVSHANLSPVKVSISQASPKTSLNQTSNMHGSMPTNFPHSPQSFSVAGDTSPFKASSCYSDGSMSSYPAVPFEAVPNTSVSSISAPNSIPFGNNSCTGMNSLGNITTSMSTSNIQDVKKVVSDLSDTPLPQKTSRVPQIYFGTRTHKQITQIVRELKKTVYRNVRMCILSSRERTCIHKTVSKSKTINNDCAELLDPQKGAGCRYFNCARNITYGELMVKGLNDCWDLEDLVNIGRKIKVCPYYTIKNLMNADIIFCPYNYLIDPGIREKMNIVLDNNVIVLDEAHNIEDSAREGASFTVTEQELQDALVDIDKLSYSGNKSYSHSVVHTVLTGLCDWISKHIDNLTDYSDFNKSGKVWSGEELVAMLSEIKAGLGNFNYIQKHFTIASSDEKNENPDEPIKPTLNASTKSLINDLLRIFDSLYTEGLKYMPDYRAVITKEIGSRPIPSPKIGSVSKNSKGWVHSLNFWCLNPAVAFSSIKNKIHSLIVASGTLSPMKTFQSELDMPFPLSLEANHVINAHQVWIGSIGYGPGGSCLKAVYQQIDTFAFQDDLGALVLQVCQVVPHGVLCFFPSYGALEKVTARWQLTGLWEKLENHKIIMCEPRKNGTKTFEEIMHDYYEIIGDEQLNGALFFAVYRGKVSEGLDFADNNARAVISIGIPYPSFKDMQVDLKRKYNDKFCNKRHLMTGSDWYETRAFRALNQALGRCIRHRNDWGALILVDDRFREKRSTIGLSKWIRNYIVHYDKFHSAINSLSDFIRNQQFMESQKPHLLSESITEEPSSPPLFE